MLTCFEAPKATLIYIFRIDTPDHRDCLKIGETSLDDDGINALTLVPNSKILNAAARKRIDQYTKTAGIRYELLYTESSMFARGRILGHFNDKEVHQVLLRSGIKRKEFQGQSGHGTEWFCTDLETAKRAILAVKEGRSALTGHEITSDQSPIVFRPEQREAIDKTLTRFKHGCKMLWNAKMRFGKTLSALQVIKESGVARTLILTHRPVVDSGWFDDFKKIFYDSPTHHYGSKNKGESFEYLEKQHKQKKTSYVYFASIQDLRGSETVGGKFDKNDAIFSTPWDLLIVDEAHEGTQTALGKAVLDELIVKNKTKVLQLSGTPFNLLDNYKEEEIYTWDYVMEQQAKAAWDKTHFGDPNPYAGLPRLNIFTYNLGKLLARFSDEEIAFNFREFFRVRDDGTFFHEQDVRSFLNLLTQTNTESNYPFSCEKFCSIFRHTLWVVPGVKAARALSKLLQTHPTFQYFQIVNVAGDGDDNEENGNALSMVQDAISKYPRTITLSCGRLTTGVSVPEWTGAFMLAGSYNTAASAYMQTIFRVQTPATINGKVKEECYVFDFAPDRTLQVLATVPKVATKAGKTTESQKQALGDFLNFCPVISVSGSKMEALNVPKMLQQLKKAYVERVVRNGFEDGSLYNDELLKLTDVELRDFENLKGVIGSTKAIGNAGNIDINNQGLTNEEYEEKEKLEHKPKKELTEEEKARLEELKKKKKIKQDAISILRGISIRMPLLIYGAELENEDEELTIDNFTSLIDPQSWEEFMPRGVTKQTFNKFKKYYDAEIFAAAGKRIRAMARAADKLTIEERIARIASIFGTFRNPDKETVLTPWKVVNMHLGDTLGGYCFYDETYSTEIEEPRYIDLGSRTRDVYTANTKLLEINSKSGLYPLYLAYNVYRTRLKERLFPAETINEHLEVWDNVVAENIFVICKTPMAKSITRRTLMGFRHGRVNTRYFEDLINQIKNKASNFTAKVRRGKSYWKANDDDNMKFNAIVGNPPYQEENGCSRKPPVYHIFYDIAFSLCEKVTMITPARFLFRAGQTPKEWMDKILNDEHFKVIRYFQKSSDVFPSVDIKGGVAIGYRDANAQFGKIGTFSEFSILSSILQKVKQHKTFHSGEFAALISSQGLYKFSDLLFREHPEALNVQGKGTAAKITSKSFSALPNIFLFDRSGQEDFIQLLGLIKGKRAIKWVKKSYIEDSPFLSTFNVFVPEANGSGTIGEALSTPLIGEPFTGHTDTFLSIGSFTNAVEAENCRKYICTKFARTLLATLKATQHNPRDTWANVPMQDFSQDSDIKWSDDLESIDNQLYIKYGLNNEETAFIEKMVKSMSAITKSIL